MLHSIVDAATAPFFDEMASRVESGGSAALVEMPADYWVEIGAIGTAAGCVPRSTGPQFDPEMPPVGPPPTTTTG